VTFSHRLAVDGVWIYPPSDYQEQPIPVAGYTLSKRAVRQGYQQIVFTWEILNQERMGALWQVWTDALANNDTRVQFTYLDKADGSLATRWGTLHEPIVNSRHTVFYEQVALHLAFISDTR
jgi:hypothetical protein